MDTEIINYYTQVLNQFLDDLRQEIKIVPLDDPFFSELEEMNLHALFFLSICQKIQTLQDDQKQTLFNEIYPELDQFSKIILKYQEIKESQLLETV